jgi:transcription termination factor Rho
MEIDSDNIAARLMDLVTPSVKGQRALIGGTAATVKTVLAARLSQFHNGESPR